MAATDSYRLAVKDTALEAPLSRSFEANVPARALQELTRIVQHGGADRIAVSLRSNQVVFEAGRRRALVAADRRPVPERPHAAAGGLRARAAARPAPRSPTSCAASRCWRRRTRRCGSSFAEGELTVSARTPDVGEARETVPVPFQGEPLEIGFNPEFLRDGLEALEGGDLVLKLISPLRPGLIEAADGSGFQYLLMPIRLNV